jgi:hypothetical protein
MFVQVTSFSHHPIFTLFSSYARAHFTNPTYSTLSHSICLLIYFNFILWMYPYYHTFHANIIISTNNIYSLHIQYAINPNGEDKSHHVHYNLLIVSSFWCRYQGGKLLYKLYILFYFSFHFYCISNFCFFFFLSALAWEFGNAH